jgi:hypothetical protein
MPGPGSAFVERAATRLKFPQLFALMATLFVLDVIFPDFVPFVDEILLGLATALFGMWRERVTPAEAPKPPEKNVTPSQPGNLPPADGG